MILMAAVLFCFFLLCKAFSFPCVALPCLSLPFSHHGGGWGVAWADERGATCSPHHGVLLFRPGEREMYKKPATNTEPEHSHFM